MPCWFLSEYTTKHIVLNFFFFHIIFWWPKYYTKLGYSCIIISCSTFIQLHYRPILTVAKVGGIFRWKGTDADCVRHFLLWFVLSTKTYFQAKARHANLPVSLFSSTFSVCQKRGAPEWHHCIQIFQVGLFQECRPAFYVDYQWHFVVYHQDHYVVPTSSLKGNKYSYWPKLSTSFRDHNFFAISKCCRLWGPHKKTLTVRGLSPWMLTLSFPSLASNFGLQWAK